MLWFCCCLDLWLWLTPFLADIVSKSLSDWDDVSLLCTICLWRVPAPFMDKAAWVRDFSHNSLAGSVCTPAELLSFVSFSDCNGFGGVSRVRPQGGSPADNRLEFGACLQLAAQRPQHFQQLTPEFYAHKGVQDGIEAAVKVTQGRSHYFSFAQRNSHFTDGGVVVLRACVHYKCDIVRRPAEKENHHQAYNDFESSLLLDTLGATTQPPQDAGVA